jgi:O-antigen ligase
MGLEAAETRKVLAFFTWGSAFCAVFGIWKHFYLHQDRIDSFSGDKMVFGGLLMMALLIQTGFLMRQPKDLLAWAFTFLNGWAFLFTETRGAWVGFLIGFILLAVRFNRRWLGMGFLILVAGYFLLPANLKDKMRSITQVRTSYNEKHEIVYSDQARFYIWNTGLKIIQDHPLGIGQGNLEEIYPKYRNPNFIETNEPHLHNNFLQITVQNGYLGLVIYLGWILAYFWGAGTFKAKDPLARDLNWIMTCCFAGVLVWGLTEYTFAQQFMYLLFSLLGLQWGLWKKGIPSNSNGA